MGGVSKPPQTTLPVVEKTNTENLPRLRQKDHIHKFVEEDVPKRVNKEHLPEKVECSEMRKKKLAIGATVYPDEHTKKEE